MGVSVVKAGPYFSSGSISFSQLRTNFAERSSGTISASQLRRNTNVAEENPIVPDSTENEQISTGSNLRLSQFRNSIKRYVATQSGTDDNASFPGEPGFRMGRFDAAGKGIDWSGGGVNGRDGQNGGTTGNHFRNVQKGILITGTCGSVRLGQAGAQMAPIATVHNVRIDVSGSILGYGGKGGGQPGSSDPSGEDGGTALNFGKVGNNNRVIVGSGARIWAGGGGGERGKTGATGANGICRETRTIDGGCNCPGCPGGWITTRGCYSGWHCSRRQECNWWRNCWWTSNGNSKFVDCLLQYTVSGGIGGTGGKGGNGRGYNNQSGSTSGESGLPGQPGGTCTSGGSPNPAAGKGENGERGGDGGNYGESGQSTPNTGNGGQRGRAIASDGGRYDVYGTVNSNTVKGSVY